MRKLFVYFLWTLLTISVLGTVFAFYAIDKGWIGYMPPVEDLQNPINRFATQIYSADGKIMGTWNYNRENRVMVDYSKLPTSLVQALVATEDVRFYDHSGIDFYALGRAIIKRGVLGQKSAGGGSTITQQLAKQLYSERAKSTMERLFQKPIEWVIAVKLERNYTKDEIITMYLNYFDFLHNAVGIKVAADTYFSKEHRSRDRRNVVLGQMLKAGYLSEADYEKYCAEPLTLKFHVSDHRDGIAVYFREFLRKYMTAKKPDRALYPSWNMVKYYNDSINWETDPLYGWCNKNRKRNGDYYSIYTDGLKVYTTIDSKMQQYAEQAAYQHVVKYLQPAFAAENQKKANAPYSSNLTPEQVRQIINRSIRQSERYRVLHESGASEDEIQKSFRTPVRMTVFTYHGEIDTTMTPIDSIRYYKSFLRTGFVSVCPQNGHVKAYVGGLNYEHFAYDMVSEGRRQVGSTIKPYLYSLAMENGFSPCDEAPNVQQTYMVAGRPWTPRNGSRARYGEMVTLKWGLQQSNNWISAYLMSKLSPQAFVDLLREYGIRNPEIHPSMSLCLGPCDISVAEMASAYTAFVNHGIRAALMYVTKIEDGEGNVIAQFQPRMNEVISEESAHKMLYMLKAVVDGGTAGRLRFKYGLKGSIAGKTGTTNNNSDAWFMGITPTLVNACWVGGDDRDIHFNTMFYGQGASMALPIFALYMQKVYADPQLGYNEDATFDLPAGYDPCSFVDEALESSDNDFEELFE